MVSFADGLSAGPRQPSYTGMCAVYLVIENAAGHNSETSPSVSVQSVRDELDRDLLIVDSLNKSSVFDGGKWQFSDTAKGEEPPETGFPIGFGGLKASRLAEGASIRFLLFRTFEGQPNVRIDELGAPLCTGIGQPHHLRLRIVTERSGGRAPIVRPQSFKVRFKVWDQPEEDVNGSWKSIPGAEPWRPLSPSTPAVISIH